MNSRYRYFSNLWLGLRPSQTYTSVYMGAIGRTCVLALVLVILAGITYSQAHAGNNVAVQPAFPPSSASNQVAAQTSASSSLPLPGEDLPLPVQEIAYWEGKSEQYLAERTRLEVELKALQKRIDNADPVELRDRINKAKVFIDNAYARRAEAPQFVDPDIVNFYDLLIRNAEQHLADRQSELNDRVRDAIKLVTQLNTQARNKQQEREMYDRLYYDATKQLADARAQHDMQAKTQQLNLLGEKRDESLAVPAPTQAASPAPANDTTSKKHVKGGR
jgi:hypothetical protein